MRLLTLFHSFLQKKGKASGSTSTTTTGAATKAGLVDGTITPPLPEYSPHESRESMLANVARSHAAALPPPPPSPSTNNTRTTPSSGSMSLSSSTLSKPLSKAKAKPPAPVEQEVDVFAVSNSLAFLHQTAFNNIVLYLLSISSLWVSKLPQRDAMWQMTWRASSDNSESEQRRHLRKPLRVLLIRLGRYRELRQKKIYQHLIGEIMILILML